MAELKSFCQNEVVTVCPLRFALLHDVNSLVHYCFFLVVTTEADVYGVAGRKGLGVEDGNDVRAGRDDLGYLSVGR
jgi:hypothetical protein